MSIKPASKKRLLQLNSFQQELVPPGLIESRDTTYSLNTEQIEIVFINIGKRSLQEEKVEEKQTSQHFSGKFNICEIYHIK